MPCSASALGALIWAPAPAGAAFGLLPGEAGFKVTATADAGGAPATLAGAHPYSLITEINFNKVGNFSDGDLKDLTYDLPAGPDRKRDLGAPLRRRAVQDPARLPL